MKALVIGCGEMGQAAVRDLHLWGGLDEILVATRSVGPARSALGHLDGSTTRVTLAPLDLAHPEQVPSMFQGVDVAVNCSGPNYRYEVTVAKAAIAARVPLVDMNDDFETTLEMLDLDAAARSANIPILLGLGASPGLNNVLVRAAANRLDEVEEIHTAWVMSACDPGGPALSAHLLHSLSGPALTCVDGAMRQVASFRDGRERLEFPAPIGAVDVFHVGHPEPITALRAFPSVRIADDKATFVPPVANEWILELGGEVRHAEAAAPTRSDDAWAMDPAVATLRERCRSLAPVPKDGALRVEVVGRHGGRRRRVIFTTAGRLASGTGIPASAGAIMILQGRIGRCGVLAPEECVDPEEFLYQLFTRRKAGDLNGWMEDG